MALGKKSARKGGYVTPQTAREAFRQIGIALSSRLELEELLKSILIQVRVLLRPRDAVILLVNDSLDGFLVYPPGRKRGPHRPSINEGMAGHVVNKGKSVLEQDAKAHEAYSERTDLKAGRVYRAICCVPIYSGETLHGVLQILGKRFSDKDLEILQTIADFAAVSIDNSRYVSKIKDLTITDDLTGLFNARHLGRVIEMEIRRAHRYSEEFSLIFIDLDKFKTVNDRFGHLVGSRVLKETGALIMEALRKDIDSAFRYGGDEFVMVLPKTSPRGAEVVAGRVRNIIRSRLFTSDNGDRFGLTASFGIAAYPRDGTTREEIVRLADEAMYEVKRSGRDGIASGLPAGKKKK